MASLEQQLSDPPIQEVVCGFMFDPMPVDPMDFGVYWDLRKDDYPNREIHPALIDGGPAVQLGPFPQRTWLISQDNSKVLQLQFDRFLVNWRRQGPTYPRFSDHEQGGIKRLSLDEFKAFRHWIEDRIKAPLNVTRLELTKIDLLVRGQHYQSSDQLGDAMEVVRVFRKVQISDPTMLQLRLVEEHEGGTTHVHILLNPKHVRIETRHTFLPKDNLDDAFSAANDRSNDIFFNLVDKSLFGVEKG